MKTDNTVTQTPATGTRKPHAWQTAAAVVVCLALAVLLVLPGFLAAWFSRMDDDVMSVNGEPFWGNHPAYDSLPFKYRLEFLALEPSISLMKHAPPARRFYNWEYRLAGGKEMIFPTMPRAMP
ncbi:MAG TPA: hypothetical protein VG733_15510 [Chthoniobacteraceae bacterium]|nr:hypothetical protein [Chthoniobacteraceae bacterium]